MSPRERLLTALRRGTPDRVPVTLYEHSPFNGDWANEEPSYAPLIDLERRLGDSIVYVPMDLPILIGDPNRVAGKEERTPECVFRRTQLETPRGPLHALARRDPGQMTWWQVEPLIKTDADIERVLSLPDPPAELDAAFIRELEQRVGENGVLCFSVGDALGHVVGLFEFGDFVMRCREDDGAIRALLDKAQSQVLAAIRAIGAIVKNTLIRLWGPEYCGAPLMNPAVYFPRYVVERDRQATHAIHATGNLSIIHCHGRLDALLEMIVETGADGLEPIETRPISTADVTLADVKRRIGDRMCLMGAIQAHTLETGTPERVATQVRDAIEAAGPGGFILLPTSAPFMIPLAPHLLANFEAMYQAAHEFGTCACG